MGRSPAYRRIDTLAPNNLSDNPNSLIQLKIRPCLFFSLARRSASSLTNGKMHLVSLLVRIQRRPVLLEVRPNTFRILWMCILSSDYSQLRKLPDAHALQNTTFEQTLQRTSNRVFIIPWWNGDVFLENQAKYYFRPQIDEVTKLYIKAHNHKHCGKPDIRIHPL